jgi:hypothetical protein
MNKDKKAAAFLSSLVKKLTLPFLLFATASYGVVAVAPLLVPHGFTEQPSTLLLAIVGVALILLSAAFLSYAAKLVGLMRGWLILGIGFSSIMIIVKFFLLPKALYSQTFVMSFNTFNPNSSGSFFFVGILLFVIYLLVASFAYSYYRRGVRSNRVKSFADKMTEEDKEPDGQYSPANVFGKLVIVALALFMCVVSGAVFILFAPLGVAFNFFSLAMAGGGVVLIGMTALTILLCVQYLGNAANKAVELKKPAILTATFWIIFSLLLTYHVLWIIFMSVLLATWPFRVISPSGK